MAELHQVRPPEAVNEGGPSDMARVAAGRPFKPYVYKGGEAEPPAVVAARERHRALNAEIERRSALIVPDPEPGYEWRRELCDD